MTNEEQAHCDAHFIAARAVQKPLTGKKQRDAEAAWTYLTLALGKDHDPAEADQGVVAVWQSWRTKAEKAA